MFEKVNPSHPDKLCDRIAGAIVDMAYAAVPDPRIAVEVLLGHGICHIIAETDVVLPLPEIEAAVQRIAGFVEVDYVEVAQDRHLARNQKEGFRCGDNGIFRGVPVSGEQHNLTRIAQDLYDEYGCDGKCIMDGDRLIICQSNVSTDELRAEYPRAEVNPLGDWTGGTDVDTGATNRKLGSDMADSITGGGLHGKDLSKADVSVNIWVWLMAQELGEPVEVCCAIGDDSICDVPYGEIVETARGYIDHLGGFEKFAEWGLVR